MPMKDRLLLAWRLAFAPPTTATRQTRSLYTSLHPKTVLWAVPAEAFPVAVSTTLDGNGSRSVWVWFEEHATLLPRTPTGWARMSAPLHGAWRTDPNDEASLPQFGDVTLEFRDDGSLLYIVMMGPRTRSLV